MGLVRGGQRAVGRVQDTDHDHQLCFLVDGGAPLPFFFITLPPPARRL